MRDIALPEHLPTELTVIDGVRYTRVPLARKALFALRPGHHPLEAASADVVVETYDPGFFAPPVPRSQQLHLATPPCVVEVQPLPPAPPGFAGAVGQLRLAAQVAPGSLPLGGATTVTVRLAGAGNLQGVAPPRLEAPAELIVSPPEQQSLDHLAGTTVEGERTWTYAVVPRSPGSFPLRVSAVPYFDPVKREYRLAMAPPLTLVALPTAAAGRRAGAPPAAGQVTAADGPGGASGSSLWESWRARADALQQAWGTLGWPGRAAWGLSLAGALALLTVLSRRGLPGSPGSPGSPGAAGTEGVRQLERRLAEAATATRPRRVAVEVEEGWRDFLAARGELPPGAPSARWPDLVRARRWPREAADDLARLTADIAYLRQAPQLSATEELRSEIVARSRKLLRKLR